MHSSDPKMALVMYMQVWASMCTSACAKAPGQEPPAVLQSAPNEGAVRRSMTHAWHGMQRADNLVRLQLHPQRGFQQPPCGQGGPG